MNQSLVDKNIKLDQFSKREILVAWVYDFKNYHYFRNFRDLWLLILKPEILQIHWQVPLSTYFQLNGI